MRNGCLFELGRWIVRSCWRLGTRLAHVLIATLAFLLFGVIGPVCLGMTGEVIRRLTGAGRGGEKQAPPALVGNRVSYILLGGTLWVVGYATVLGLVSLASSYVVAAIPASQRPVIATGLAFVLGATVGALAYRYDAERR